MTDASASRRSAADVVALSLSTIGALFVLVAAVIFVLLRTTGIGPYRFPQEPRLAPVAVEALVLVGAGLALYAARSMTRQLASVTLIFGASGFVAMQGLAFAFGLDPTSAPLQVAALTGTAAGTARLLGSRGRRLVDAVTGVVAFLVGGAIAMAMNWVVNLM